MNIKFNSVELHNFMSYRDTTISLSNNGYVFVRGKNRNTNDLAESNGSGKSAIWESISWCLTGNTIRGSKDIVNDSGEDGCYVKLDFNIGNDNYVVLRSREHKVYKTNLKIFVNDIDKSGKGIRDSEKLLSEYLPDLDSQLIGSVIILGQGLPNRFTNNTPSGRKDLLEKLSQSEFMIEDLKDRVTKRKVVLDSQQRDYQNREISLTTSLTKDEQTLKNLHQRLSLLVDIDELTQRKETLQEQLQSITDAVEKSQNEIKSLNDKISNAETIIDNSDEKKKNEVLVIQKKLWEDTNPLHDKKSSLSADQKILELQISSLKSEIRKLKSVTDVCPTCHQKLPNVHLIDTTEMEEQLKQLIDKFREKDNGVKTLNETINKMRWTSSELIESVKTQHDNSVLELRKSVFVFNSSLSQEKRNYEQLVCQQSDVDRRIKEVDNEIQSYNITKQYLTDEINNTNSSIEKTQLALSEVQEKLTDILSHQEVIGKFSTILKRDFRGYLLSNVIEYINRKAKSYCQDIFETTDIGFALDGNNISISYCGKEYESLSGGEKQKIDVIIQLSIRDMLCNYLNFSSNILVLDEITDNLDNIGCEKIINLISTRLKDVDSIYLISHRRDLNIPCDRTLFVTKDENGISTAAME